MPIAPRRLECLALGRAAGFNHARVLLETLTEPSTNSRAEGDPSAVSITAVLALSDRYGALPDALLRRALMDLGSWVRTERVVKQLRVNKDNLIAESAAMTANNPDDQVATGRGHVADRWFGALAGLGGLATGSLVRTPAWCRTRGLPPRSSRPTRSGHKSSRANSRHARHRSGRLFVVDSRGKLYWVDRSTGAAKIARDLKKVRGGAVVAPTSPRGMGFRSFAFHPDGGARGGRVGTRSTRSAPRRSPGPPVYHS